MEETTLSFDMHVSYVDSPQGVQKPASDLLGEGLGGSWVAHLADKYDG